MHSFECVLQQHPVAALQRAEHTARLALAGIAAEAERLQVVEDVGTAVVPPLRGRLRLWHDLVHRQGSLVFMGAAALAAAPGASVNPDFDRAADRGAGAAPVG